MDGVAALREPLVGLGGRAWQVADAGPAQARQPGPGALPHDREGVRMVDHLFALNGPTLVSAPNKKSISRMSTYRTA